MSRTLTIANRIALPAEPPSRIVIIPAGESRRRNGDAFLCNAEDAAAVIADYAAHAVRFLPIDKEHQTLGGPFASPNGDAPAVGWMSDLKWVEGEGVVANTEWTPEGEELIRSKKYRYISNVISFDEETRRISALHSAGLTNKPALARTRPLANKEEATDAERVEQVREFLGLPKTATRKEILGAFNALINRSGGRRRGAGTSDALPGGDDEFGLNREDTPPTLENKNMKDLNALLTPLRELAGVSANSDGAATLAAIKERLSATPGLKVAACKELGLAETAADADILAAIGKLKGAKAEEPTDAGVLRGELDTVKTALTTANAELTALRAESTARKAAERIEKAKAEGKVTEPMLAANSEGGNFYRELAADDKRWDAWYATAAVVAPTSGRMVDPSRRTSGGASNDPIAANAERFDAGAMPDYERVKKYQAENKCGYEAALAACGLA